MGVWRGLCIGLWGGLVAAQLDPWGIWTLQQVGIPLDRGQRWQFSGITQPRVAGGHWEGFVGVGLIGYRLRPNHMFLGGLTNAHIFRPSAWHQVRLMQRWRSTFLPEQQLLLRFTLEERWTNGRFTELAFRPFTRYRWPIEKGYLNLMHELIGVSPATGNGAAIQLRQNRIWAYVSFPRSSRWLVELGYLNLSRPGRTPAHRLWVGFRWRLDQPIRLHPPGSDTADPVAAAQTLLLESPAESLVP